LEKVRLVLASSSKIRRDIINQYDYKCIFKDHNFDEEGKKKSLKMKPIDLSLHLAKQKALSLCVEFKDHIILGCDQICLMGERVLSKPATIENAIKNLTLLSGKTHKLIGSYVFVKNGSLIFHETIISTLTMRKLSQTEISDYVLLDKPLQSCGSYMFEKNGYKLFSKVRGSLEEINGLPFKHLMNQLGSYV
tara:strand:- start:904 stop:1479 length:576 start_codon:yes stop_codon:yes gene_type:complete